MKVTTTSFGAEAKNDCSYSFAASHTSVARNRDNFKFMFAKSTAKHVSVSECRNVKTFDMQ